MSPTRSRRYGRCDGSAARTAWWRRGTRTTRRWRGRPPTRGWSGGGRSTETWPWANSGQPDAARYLLGWAHAAGFSDVVASAGVWCFATPEDRMWWGSTWADRISGSALADQAVERGLADPAELDDIADGWRAWAADADGWFCVVHGQVVCRP